MVDLCAGFKFMTPAEIESLPRNRTTYSVEGLLTDNGLSLLTGKPKAGKSTLARQIAFAIATGQSVLDRPTVQGSVLHVALEEQHAAVYEHFKMLGLTEDTPIKVHCGSLGMKREAAIVSLRGLLEQDRTVKLVILDPLFKFLGERDANDYAKLSNALEPLMQLARDCEVCILAVHHAKKRVEANITDNALGSTAISAAVDTQMFLDMRYNKRSLATVQRSGKEMQPTELDFDEDTHSFTIKGAPVSKRIESKQRTHRRIKDAIRAELATERHASQKAITDAVTGKRETVLQVLRELVADGLVIEEENTDVLGTKYGLPERVLISEFSGTDVQPQENHIKGLGTIVACGGGV